MTEPPEDVGLCWGGTIALYVGILLVVTSVIWFLVVIVAGNIRDIVGPLKVVVPGGVIMVGGGYITHFWGTPWEPVSRVMPEVESMGPDLRDEFWNE